MGLLLLILYKHMKNLEQWLKDKILPQKNKPSSQQPPAEMPKKSFFQTKDNLLRIIPLGGLDQVGRNMMVFENRQDIVIIDCGLQFPDDVMLGVDYVIPDVSYLEKKKQKIRGIIITHGHLDHIGALKHVLPKIGFPPVFGSRISIGLIQKQLEEVGLTNATRLTSVEWNEKLTLGSFSAEFARITHNVPGSYAVILHTNIGTIVHTGDFKFDFTAPQPNDIPDFEKLIETGNKGVLFLMSDSTNATKEGYAKPEIEVGKNLDTVIRDAKGRVIIASFSSNLARLQQIINSAVRYERKIFLSGRSMVENLAIAKRLGYVKYPEKAISKISKAIHDIPDHQVMILSTGSQGEEFSALTRMANDEHAQVEIQKGDTILFSSHPIPGTGNERAIIKNINKFLKKGALVITNDDLDLHTTGHGNREDLKLMLQLTQPKYFMPVHGEYFMRVAHKDLAIKTGMAEQDIYLPSNGDVIDIHSPKPPAIHAKGLDLVNVYIDGLGGTEKEGARVLEERKKMSQDGVLILVFKVTKQQQALIGQPKVISRGFIYLEELEKLTDSIAQEGRKIFTQTTGSTGNTVQQNQKSHRDIREEVRRGLGKFVLKKIGREPLIIPIIIEIDKKDQAAGEKAANPEPKEKAATTHQSRDFRRRR